MSKPNGFFRKVGRALTGAGKAVAEGSPVGVALEIADKLVDRYAVRRKMTEHERVELEAGLRQAAYELDTRDRAELHGFILDYEGRAGDQRPFIQVIRGLIRPALTVYITVMFHWAVWRWLALGAAAGEQFLTILKLLFMLALLVLGFWFGDRALQRIGLADFLRGRASG